MSPKKSTPKKSGEGRSAARKTATSKVTTSNTARPRAEAAKKAAPKKAATVKPDQMDAELLEFIQAIDDYKRTEGRPFPTWSEILEIVKDLGYERSA